MSNRKNRPNYFMLLFFILVEIALVLDLEGNYKNSFEGSTNLSCLKQIPVSDILAGLQWSQYTINISSTDILAPKQYECYSILN